MNKYNMTNYDDVYTSFTWDIPERYNFAHDVIDYWAGKDAQMLAMLWTDGNGREERRTFSDIAKASRKLCNILKEAGVRRGDTIIVMLGRQIEWWEIFTASLRMGAVISPGTTQLSSKDLLYRITAASCTCVITDKANAGKVDEIAGDCPSLKVKVLSDDVREGWISYNDAMDNASDCFETVETSPNDEAICYFTSGTTGYPKMCMHTHGYAIAQQNTGKYWLDLRPGELHWNISDTGWAKAAYSSYFGPWSCGATLFVHHSENFNVQHTLELLEKYPISTFCGAPTIYRLLVQEDLQRYKFAHLRHCVAAGEPLNPEIIEIWKKLTGITIRDGYGQTETPLLCASFPCIEPRPGSMGKPSPGVDLQIIDNDAKILSSDVEGDIAVKIKPENPPGIFKEYKNNPIKTAETVKGEWYLTGDRGYKDDDGYFWFVGRADDVILSSGYRIGPFEVESALIEHAAVTESAVVSSPDNTRGEVVKAFVILAQGFEASDDLKKELQEYVKSVTAPYKYPRKLEFVDALPKTVSGKIRRVELREREWDGVAKQAHE